MDKIAAGLRLQNKRNAFLFNAQQDIAPLFAAFVSDGNDDGGGDYATLHVCLLFARFGGAVLAWILYSTLFTQFETVHHMVRGSLESLQLASIFSTYPAPELSIWHAALVEVVITSMLMGMIMALTDDGNGVPKGPLAPLLIGILVAVIGASTGPLTGFAMNPARDFGPKLFTWFAGWGNIAMTGGRNIPYFIVPIIAPLLGACLGAAIYRFLIANNLPCHTCVEEENTR